MGGRAVTGQKGGGRNKRRYDVQLRCRTGLSVFEVLAVHASLIWGVAVMLLIEPTSPTSTRRARRAEENGRARHIGEAFGGLLQRGFQRSNCRSLKRRVCLNIYFC